MGEIIFEVTEAPEGGYNARALGHSVFTQGDDWDDLREMVRDAVLCHFDDQEPPKLCWPPPHTMSSLNPASHPVD